MNELVAFLILFAVGIWMAHKPIDKKQYSTNIMQGELMKLWQDAFQNIAQNNVGRAERSLLALLKLDAKNVGAYNKLGTIYARQGLRKEAIECFEISSSLSSNASAYHNLALAHILNEDSSKAVRAFEHAIEKDPQNPARYIAMARILDKMGENKSAIKQLEKAHRLAPGGKGSELLAQAYRESKATDLAMEVEREAKLLGISA